MLILVLLIAAFNLASSAPVPPLTPNFDGAVPLTILGRELPDSANTRHERTIQDIIWSCLATIFACSWVAVHPNVPRPTDSKWRKFWERVLVMIYAILAPEFVIAWAMRQWRGAVRHAAEYNQKHHGVTPPSSYLRWYIKHLFCQDEKPGLWTITHGFLLEMHGLVDDSGKLVRSVDEIFNPLNIVEEEISDKSKGDFLTKLLVLLQTTWFVFQCLARWIEHLPVTELEVVTLAFALLNIGTYTLWWNKPQGMGLAIQMDGYRRPKKGPQERKERVGGDMGNAMRGTGDRPNQRSGFLSRAAETVKQLICRLGARMSRLTIALHPRHLQSLTFKDIIEVIKEPFQPLFAMLFNVKSGKCEHIFYSSRDNDTTAGLSMMIIGTVFGGLHLIPLWSSSFPSSPEKLLWMLSALFITIQPLLFICSLFVGARIQYVKLRVVIFFLMLGFFALYVVARVILVTLAFTTLRELPPDASRDIAWTTFLPHF